MTFLFIFTLLNYINDYLYLKVKFEILNKMNIPQQHDVQLCFGSLPSERERQRHEPSRKALLLNVRDSFWHNVN